MVSRVSRRSSATLQYRLYDVYYNTDDYATQCIRNWGHLLRIKRLGAGSIARACVYLWDGIWSTTLIVLARTDGVENNETPDNGARHDNTGLHLMWRMQADAIARSVLRHLDAPHCAPCANAYLHALRWLCPAVMIHALIGRLSGACF